MNTYEQRISIINDEISTDVATTINFFKANDVKNIEIRTIGKKNIVDLDISEVEEIAALLKKNAMNVSAIASPLFKWSLKNEVNANKMDTFYFNQDIDERAKRAYITKTIQLAKILKTDLIRVFSTLRPKATVRYSILGDPLFNFALDEAQKAGVLLALENEPPCFVHKMDDIKHIFDGTEHPALKLWFDVANFYKVGDKVSREDLECLSGAIRYFHLKDFDVNGNYVPLGKGIINYERILEDIKSIFDDANIYLSLETHVKSPQEASTLEALTALKQILAKRRPIPSSS
jgi:sugar phosphate isomerase/epimerase